MALLGYPNNLSMISGIDNSLLGGNSQHGNISEITKKQAELVGLRQQSLNSSLPNMSNWNGNPLLNPSSNITNFANIQQQNNMYMGNNTTSWMNNGNIEYPIDKGNVYMGQGLQNMQLTGGQQTQLNSNMVLNNLYGTNQIPNQRIGQTMGLQTTYNPNHIKAAQLAQSNEIYKRQMLGALNNSNTLINQNTISNSNPLLNNNPLLNSSALLSANSYGNNTQLRGLNGNVMGNQSTLATNPLMATSNPLLGGNLFSGNNGLNSMNQSVGNQIGNPMMQMGFTGMNASNPVMNTTNQMMLQKNFGQSIDPTLQAKMQMNGYPLATTNPLLSTNLNIQATSNGMPYLNNFDKRPF